MKKAVSVLDEVQTIAYANTSMRYNTGDITTINSKEIARNSGAQRIAGFAG